MEQSVKGKKVKGTPVDDQGILDALMDDAFWLEQGKTWVTSAFEDINKRSERVQAAVVWFFGVCSLATIVTSITDGTSGKTPTVLLLLPLLLFLVAYGLQVFAQTLVFKEKTFFQSPEMIEDTHFKIVKDAKCLINTGAILTFLALALTPVILLWVISNQPTTPKAIAGPYIVTKPIVLKDSSITKVLITGRSGPFIHSHIEVKLKTPSAETVVYSDDHLADSLGVIDRSIMLTQMRASKETVIITTLDMNTSESLTTTITRQDSVY